MKPDRVLPGQFMHLSKELRDYLAEIFAVPMSGITEVRDQEVISDGHTYADLEVITLEKMCEYIGSTETFARAWEITCSKAHTELHPPIQIGKSTVEDSEEENTHPEDTDDHMVPTE